MKTLVWWGIPLYRNLSECVGDTAERLLDMLRDLARQRSWAGRRLDRPLAVISRIGSIQPGRSISERPPSRPPAHAFDQIVQPRNDARPVVSRHGAASPRPARAHRPGMREEALEPADELFL